MMTQKDIANFFGVTQSFISRVSRKERAVTWGMAERLFEEFPEKDIRTWKKASFEDIKSALYPANSKLTPARTTETVL